MGRLVADYPPFVPRASTVMQDGNGREGGHAGGDLGPLPYLNACYARLIARPEMTT
jgi:hypothetical protein